jgi:hypothetical protein
MALRAIRRVRSAGRHCTRPTACSALCVGAGGVGQQVLALGQRLVAEVGMLQRAHPLAPRGLEAGVVQQPGGGR